MIVLVSLRLLLGQGLVNPRRAYAARVTVVGSVGVCVCVCVCVCVSPNISLIECLFVPQTIRLT